jgi:hypothetical protein
MTPSGMEPANCRLVAQCLHQLRHRVPPNLTHTFLISLPVFLANLHYSIVGHLNFQIHFKAPAALPLGKNLSMNLIRA